MRRACCVAALVCTNGVWAAPGLGRSSSSSSSEPDGPDLSMRVPWSSLRTPERARLLEVGVSSAEEWAASDLQQSVHAAVMARSNASSGADLRTLLAQRLEPLLWVKSLEWNRSAITLGFANDEVNDFGLGAGWIEWGSEEAVTSTDRLAWGSVTKVYTAAAAMQLVDSGAAPGLDNPIAPLMDRLLEAINSTTLGELWSPEVARELTLAQALGMRSSLSDFETDVPLRRLQLDDLAAPIQVRACSTRSTRSTRVPVTAPSIAVPVHRPHLHWQLKPHAARWLYMYASANDGWVG